MNRPLNGCMCQSGDCDSCNRLAEAFEAMREALIRLISFFGNPLTTGDVSRLRFTTTIDGVDVQRARQSLALADKVTAHE